MSAINHDNWNYAHFIQGNWRAQITFGAEPGRDMVYYVSLLDAEYNAIFQRTFNVLDEAIGDINQRYGHWDAKSGIKEDKGGCGSCSAH